MTPVSSIKHTISAREIPSAVRRIVTKLEDNGYDSKIVGGCIRDLLLDRKPKDFDVVTEARPNQIKGLFPSSRIIGRRFKLVHVRSGKNTIEVSTYRRRTGRPSGKAIHRHLNLYGSVDEDYWTRDFTVNSLYYDCKAGEILDYVGGLNDIDQGVLRCIGKPRRRIVEDPCRILRAARFIAKLPLALDLELEEAIYENRNLISQLKPARLQNEMEKMFLTGSAVSTYQALHDLDLLQILFPQSTDNSPLALAAMQSTDFRFSENKPVKLGFLIAAIHWEQFRRLGRYDPSGRMSIDKAMESAECIIKRQRETLSMPLHIRDFVRDMWILQTQIERTRPKRVKQLLEHMRFRAAYDLLVLRASVGDADASMAQWWTDLQEMDEPQQDAAIVKKERRHRQKRNRQRDPVALPSAAVSN
ncbi:MAG: polynucleotide adenylyltransferase PcnB [Gammaproteobacteria bacterium]|nr:polynucleotide adenylyltransferase PcnB [Gammaproteobacteria bacterium]